MSLSRAEIYQRDKEKVKKKAREYYWANKEKVLAYKKREQEEHPERVRKRKRKTYDKNSESILEKKKIYFIENKDKIIKHRKDRYQRDRENILQKGREWRQANPDKIKMYLKSRRGKARIYERERYKKPQVKINRNMKHLIWCSLKGRKEGKSWKSLVNYSLEELMSHLESLFIAGMTWDNYGKWHIDHVTPVSIFSIQSYDDKEFKECWALENLQPLWASDNQSKGGGARWLSKQ